jgi:CRISPR-associated protein Cas1
MQLVLDTKGLKLLKKRSSFLIEPERGSPRLISPKKLTSIAITQSCLLSSEAVALAIQHEIPILFFDRIGKAQARLWSPYFGSIATLRRQQARFSESPDASAWIIRLFGLKAEGQARNLDLLARQQAAAEAEAGQAAALVLRQTRAMEALARQPIEAIRAQLMGLEGSAARAYWQAVSAALPPEYAFQKRSRQPALDPFNAALNYLYGMLYSVVEGALFAAGLDPHLGILHSDEYNKPVLAFDLIEPFRPWIDRLLIEACFQRALEGRFFTQNQHGLFLNKEGKAWIIPLFNDYLRSSRSFLGREASVKNHIYALAGKLAQRIRSHSAQAPDAKDPEYDDSETDDPEAGGPGDPI